MTFCRQPPTWPRLEPLEPRLLLAATTVFYDGFENTFPGTNWVVASTGGNTSRKWDDNHVEAAAGQWSVFCGEDGSTAADNYVNSLTTTMERRNVSLVGFQSAALTFQYLLNSESGYDFFKVRVKQSSTWSEVFSDSGDKSALGWQTKTLDLSAYKGLSGLTIQFYFISDSAYVPSAPSGVWLDEVSLIGNPQPDLIGWDCYAPNSAFWGQTNISLHGQVKNIGMANAGAFTQKFYLSPDTTWGEATDYLLGSYSHAALAGSTLGTDFYINVTLPGNPPNATFGPSGTYYIGMKTDAAAQVTESDETNNGPGGPLSKWADWDDISIDYNTHVDLTLFKVTDTSGTPNSASPGVAKSTFNPGETARITLKAANSGPSRYVQLGLVLYGPDNTTVVYDSHDPLKTPSGHVEDLVPAAPLAEASTSYYSFDWCMPNDAPPGAFDIVAAIRDSVNWNNVFDNTAPGAGTAGFGPEARVRDQLWRYQAAPANRTSDDTSEYMMGKVQVNVVLPASTGAASTEAWTVQEINDIEREVAEGAGWWATTLPDAHLSFHLDTTYADNPIPTTLEPISQTPANDYLWMNDMLTVLAPGTTGTTDARLQTYTDLTRRASGSDWAFTVFVVDDTNDADHAFAGSGNWFAYADLGGPTVVMTYHNDGWGIDGMDMVFAHETAHIFYALDEYSGSGGRYTDYSGYLNIQNLNAVDGHPPPITIVPSLMGEADKQKTAFANHTSSPTSLQMLGYRDSDSDHIPDILATPPSLATTILAQDVVAGSISIRATAAIVPLANNNPNSESKKHAISLNTVSGIQYKVDGGSWLDLAAQDLAYDGPQETAVLQLSGLSGGSHHIYLRSRNSVGSWSPDGVFSIAADVPFTVNQRPVVGSLAAAPDPLIRGANLTLTAANVTDADGTVAAVEFYRDSNNDGVLEVGTDQYLGTAAQSGSNWSWTGSTSGFPLGGNVYFAQAQDNVGAWGAAASATGTVNLAFVSVVATDPFASEAGHDKGTYTFTRVGDLSVGLTVNYAVTGGTATPADYQPLAGSVAFAVSQATATVDLFPVDNRITEPDKTVVLTISPAPSYTVTGSPATVTINEFPVITGVKLNNRIGCGPGSVDPSGLGVRAITVNFSEAVTFADADVTVEAVAFPPGSGEVARTITSATVAGSGTGAMTITLPFGEAMDTWVRVRLSGTGIKDLANYRLDGDPRSGNLYIVGDADLPTGDGVEGGDAVFYVGSLRGDMDGDRAVTAADKAAFMTKWAARDMDADLRGTGFGVRPPDGKITLSDIDGFTSVFLAARAAGRSLATLPAGHPLGGDVTPLPVLAGASIGVDILAEAAGKVQPAPVLPGGGSPAGAPLTAASASAATSPGGSSGDPLKVRQALAPSAEDASDAVLRV